MTVSFKKAWRSILAVSLLLFISGIPGNAETTTKSEASVALIIDDALSDLTQTGTIKSVCLDDWKKFEGKRNYRPEKGIVKMKMKFGSRMADLLREKVCQRFAVCDLYKDRQEIKDTRKYWFILVPHLIIQPGYKEEEALNQEYVSVGLGWRAGGFYARSRTTLNVEVLDPVSNTVAFNAQTESTAEDRVRLPLSCWKDLFFGEGYDWRLGEFNEQLSLKAASETIEKAVAYLDQKLLPLAVAKAQERALPSSLSLSVAFSDKYGFNPNSVLDAGENAEILVTAKNDGKGMSYGTVLKLDAANSKVQADEEVAMGDIPPNESREVKAKVKAALDLADGTVPFTILCTEKRGYDSKKYTLNVSAAPYQKPDLVITGYKINDSSTGLGQGNGNGIPENGETIEIIALMQNNGPGIAYQVRLSLASVSSGIEERQKNAIISHILPGQVASGSLSFAIPATYSGKAVDVAIAAGDVRGAAQINKLFALNTAINQPSLAYTYRLLDHKGNIKSVLQNGESGEIELHPSNKGRLEARDVTITLSSRTIQFSKSEDKILRIAAQADYPPIRFPFQVPRVTDKQSVDIGVKLSQKDFPGITDTMNIPLRLTRPELKVVHQVIDRAGRGTLQQGETAELLVRVENTGQIDAEEVVLSLDVTRKGVILQGGKQLVLGRIEAGKSSEPKKLSLAVQRLAEAGDLPLQFTVTEKTFGATTVTLAARIVKEQEEVITVKGQEAPRPVAVTFQNMPPVIAVATPSPNERVASEQIALKGVVTDDRGVTSIDIALNGRRLTTAGRSVQVRERNQRRRDFAENILLQPGTNTIIITAYDTDNLSSSETITIHREAKRGRIWAVVIGINRYRNSRLNLNFARNDAQAFADYMKTNMGLDANTLFELYDERATLNAVRSLLGNQLRAKVANEDTVFIFFAGHGAPEADPSVVDSDKIRKYILTHDAELDDLYTTALSMDSVADIFQRLQANRIIFIADSCYSGAGGGRTILAQGTRAVLSDEFLKRLSQGKGRIILTSSRENEVSQESNELRHGYFTYYLLEGLKGKADMNRDGVVDMDEITLYLNRHVPEATNQAQHPVKKGETEGQVIVGRVKGGM